VLAGRDSFDSANGDARPYGEEWQGTIFVLTHHPEDARPVDDITILSCPVEDSVAIARHRGASSWSWAPPAGAAATPR
jgi:hypothetical protein